MAADERVDVAIELLRGFADRTGVASEAPQRRYLWTDAFAVATWVGLGRTTRDQAFGQLALGLVDRVHGVLGRHRGDDGRSGWLSGLDGAQALAHPTIAGLRIGKSLPERPADERPDHDLEWDRDGQYFHYLTKWMHALDRAARFSGRTELCRWSVELAHASHRAFVAGAPSRRRMFWKLSIDLSRPLVGSMGQHDPIDGHVTFRALDATARAMGVERDGLAREADDFATLIDPRNLLTTDPLGIGGLLVDGCLLAELGGEELARLLLAAAEAGLADCVGSRAFQGRAERRLAFRELGLAIGLAAIERLDDRADALDPATRTRISSVARFSPVREAVERFWLVADHRRTETWREHADINDVMLATSLAPDGFLMLDGAASSPRMVGQHAQLTSGD